MFLSQQKNFNKKYTEIRIFFFPSEWGGRKEMGGNVFLLCRYVCFYF